MKKIYWSERGSVCITAIKKVTDTTLHVLCWVKLLGRHSCWESHLHVRLTSLTVINCICGTERKRTPVSVPYTGYELSVFFFFKKVFKPMWSLILQKNKGLFVGLCVLPQGQECGALVGKQTPRVAFHLLVILHLLVECHRFPFKLILL